MEKIFLKIARYSLVTLIAITLLLTVVAVIYGAINLIPVKQPEAPAITVKFDEMKTSFPSSASQTNSDSGSQQLNVKPVLSPECGSVATKINNLNKQIGWSKSSQQSYNSSTGLLEDKPAVNNRSLDTDESSRLCKLLDGQVVEYNGKLSAYFKHVDLKAGFYSGFDSFLNSMLADAARNQSLAPGDNGRYFTISGLQWYVEHYEKAVDEVHNKAVQSEEKQVEKKRHGKAALYTAACAFGFFFTCCLVLVFMRIELNTRELVDVLRKQEVQKADPDPAPALPSI